MGFFGEYWMELMLYIIALLIGAVGVIYMYISHKQRYWTKIGVPHMKPDSLLGNLKDSLLMKLHIGEDLRNLYFKTENHKYVGFYNIGKPTLMIRDPELIKTFLVKNFSHFHDQTLQVDEKVDPIFAKNLFSTRGQKWRSLRVSLTPIFTSGKLKKMFMYMVESGQDLNKYLEDKAMKNEMLNVKDFLTKFTTDVIGSCAFGIKCNAMKVADSEFRRMGNEVFAPTFKNGLNTVLRFLAPNLADLLRLRFISEDTGNFFKKLVKDSIEHRENNNIVRNDLIDLLMQIKKKGYIDEDDDVQENGKGKEKEENGIGEEGNGKLNPKRDFTDDDITAQAVVFFIGGFETSATSMSYTLYELGVNQDVQKKLTEEIDRVLEKHKQLTYEALQEMEYLDMVLNETLRKYTPAPLLTRECTKDFTIPGTNATIKKGMHVFIPVLGLHYDPQYYPNPQKFEPERFTEKNKNSRPSYTYLPFGEGPRMCIGNRFALLQSKVGLVSMLRSYQFRVCSKTVIPPKISAKSLAFAPEGGVWLQIVKKGH